MSTVDFSALVNALATLFENRIQNQIQRATVLMQMIPTGDGPGKNITWNARFGSAVSAPLADGNDQSAFNNDSKVPATLNYGTYTDGFAITGKAIAAAANTRNPQELEDLFSEELGDSTERFAKGIAQDIYSGTGATDHIMGLCDDTAGALLDSGSYAGVDRGTYPQWAANLDTNGGTPRALTFDLMRSMRTAIYVASGLKPDLIITTPQLHGKFGSLFGTNRRYVQDIYLRGQKIVLSGGYGALFFDDVPVIEDVDCPSGEMLFLNTRLMALRQLPDPGIAAMGSMGSVSTGGTEEEQFGMPQSRLRARVNPLARTGDKYKFQLIAYPQVQVRRPNAMGRITNLNYAL